MHGSGVHSRYRPNLVVDSATVAPGVVVIEDRLPGESAGNFTAELQGFSVRSWDGTPRYYLSNEGASFRARPTNTRNHKTPPRVRTVSFESTVVTGVSI